MDIRVSLPPDILTDVGCREDLHTALSKLCSQRRVEWVLTNVCSKAGLKEMLEKRSHAVGDAIEMGKLVKEVLRAFDLRFPSEEVVGPKGIRRRLREMEERIDDIVGSGRATCRPKVDFDALRGFNISCWCYIEKFLKQLLGFYSTHFERFAERFAIHVAEELRKAFRKTCRVKGKAMGYVLRAFEEVESLFETGETQRQRKKRERWISEALKEVDGSQSVLDWATREEETAREKNREIAMRLRCECERSFGRPKPFSLIPFNELRASLRKYRNPYAHETVEELLRRDPSGKDAKSSVKSALELVGDLTDIAPRLIFMVGETRDAYGRRAILYLGEDDAELTESEPLLGKTRHFYHETVPFEPFAAWFIVESDDNHEPPVYRYEEVESAVTGG